MKIENEVLHKIWEDRYKKGNETIDDNIRRVAKYIAFDKGEEEEFYNIMSNGYFLPAGRTMSNSGIGSDLTLGNCFTLNFVEDSITDIFDKVKMGAITQKAGGGTGYEFSKIRPNGTPTSNDAIASGVVSFMEVFNAQTSCILQGGRRGANMSVLSIRHPDILEYIQAKSYEEGKLVHFNMSVMVDDEFMVAVENDLDFNLHYPIYDNKGFIIKDESLWKIKKPIKARELWDIIMKKAYDNGEPGILFYENINKDNNTYYMENIVNTNPCGEYLSGMLYDNVDLDSSNYKGACNLGSLFLHNFVIHPFTKEASIDLQELQYAIRSAVRMLDNIIDINKFPHKDYENYQKTLRTIGLGISGLADAMAMLGFKYGDKDSIEFTDNIMNFITCEAYYTSTLLAKEKGCFPSFIKDKFIKSEFIQKHLNDKKSGWDEVVNNIEQYGIRNARLISVAPTGTLSLTFGNNCSSGLEPIFSLEYDRKVKMGGQSDDNIKIVKMEDYAYKLWKEFKKRKECIVNEEVFVTAMNLDVSTHIDILSTIAYHTDMSCSKTINVPTDYPFNDCKDIYMRAWKEGIKGCTIFRPNEIRQGILISPNDKTNEPVIRYSELQRGEWKPLADDTVYIKKPLKIGCGKLKLFIGYSPSENCIQDLYIKKAGNGGCVHNIEAVAVGLSAVYRLGGSTKNIEKAFSGLGGCNSFLQGKLTGKELSKGSSCATAILNILKDFEKELNLKPIISSNLDELSKAEDRLIEGIKKQNQEIKDEMEQYKRVNGETAFAKKYMICPLCNDEIHFEGGCLSCPSCGWSKCE